LFGGVGAQQAVLGITAGDVLGGQVGAGLARPSRTRAWNRGKASEAGGGRDAGIGARVQAEEMEQARGALAELGIGPGECGPDARGGIAAVQGIESGRCRR